MTNPEMTREKAILEIYRTAHKYGLRTCEAARGYDIPGILREGGAYIDITIREEAVPETHNRETRKVDMRFAVSGSVCQMNPNADVDELLRASHEIQQGALFILAMERLNITWTQAL